MICVRKNIAKRDFMTQKASAQARDKLRAAFHQAPSYPNRVGYLMRSLKQALSSLECPPGTALTQKQLSRLLGIPRSTLNDWFHSALVPPLRYLLCGLERLPEPARMRFLREVCRECPRLEHPWLSHDSKAIDCLKALIAEPTGLTVVQGDQERARTFLMNAIGNSAPLVVPGGKVSGLDLHSPDWFVPAFGVLYACPQAGSATSTILSQMWQHITHSGARLLLFNGIWTAFPEARTRILALTATHHVIVADAFPSPVRLPETRGRSHAILVNSAPNNRILLKIEVVDGNQETANPFPGH